GDLDLEVVVPRAERAELIPPAREGTRAHLRGVGARQAAALLGPVEVLLGGEAVAAAPAGALLEHVGEVRLAELDEALGTDAGGHALEQRVDQLADARTHLLLGQVGQRDPHLHDRHQAAERERSPYDAFPRPDARLVQRTSEGHDGRPAVLVQHEIEDPALLGGDGRLVEHDEAHGPPRLPERRKAEGGAEIGGADGVVPSLDQLRAQKRAGPLVVQDEEDYRREAQTVSPRRAPVVMMRASSVSYTLVVRPDKQGTRTPCRGRRVVTPTRA